MNTQKTHLLAAALLAGIAVNAPAQSVRCDRHERAIDQLAAQAGVLPPLKGEETLSAESRLDIFVIWSQRRAYSAQFVADQMKQNFPEADYQRQALEQADILWKGFSANDVLNTIVPALHKENRQVAIKLWENAQAPAAIKEEKDSKSGSQNVEREFEKAEGRDLPENKPFDERQRKYPFPL